VESLNIVNDTKAARPKRKWEGSKYVPKRKVCSFCSDKIDNIDYKDAVKLRAFISERGKIDPRRKTGTCAKHQRALAVALKRARHLALIPYVPEHVAKTGGVGIRL
jgi:small subunit ribosomal protein S18